MWFGFNISYSAGKRGAFHHHHQRTGSDHLERSLHRHKVRSASIQLLNKLVLPSRVLNITNVSFLGV